MSYLRHPVVSNPASWIKTVHSPSLYKSGHYNLSSTFVHSLLDTKADGSAFRFPKGDMIRLSVEKSSSVDNKILEAQEKPAEGAKGARCAKYWIAPSHSPNPASYIINNRKYVNAMYLDKKHIKFYPKKYSHKNPGSMRGETTFVPEIDQIILRTYVENIRRGIEYMNTHVSEDNHCHTFILRETGPTILTGDNVTYVNLSRYLPDISQDHDLVIPYLGNEELHNNIINLINYNS